MDSASGACTTCAGNTHGSWTTLVFAGGVFFVGGATSTALLLKPRWLFDPETGFVEKVAKTNVVRFSVVTSQIVSSLENVHVLAGGSSYPYPFNVLSSVLGSVFSLGMFDLLPVDCWITTSWYEKLVVTTAVPLALVVMAVLANLIYAALTNSGFKLKGFGTKYAFMYLFYFLPGASIVICQSFRCAEFDDGTNNAQRYLAADLSVSCDSDEYTSITSYAGVMLALLPVGVPLTMHATLYASKGAIQARATRTGDAELEHLSVWFAPYKPEKWW